MILNGTASVENDRLHIVEHIGTQDERDLLQRLAAGDIEAYKSLYKRYQPVLQRYLHPFRSVEEPEEIIQDIFLKLWIKRSALTAVRSFEQYIFRMARNRVLDLQKSNKARVHRETIQGSAMREASAARELEYKEFFRYALNAIARLPERQRRIYELSVFHDHSLDEIGVLLGLSKSVVIKQLYLATRTIRRELRKYGDALLLTLVSLFLS